MNIDHQYLYHVGFVSHTIGRRTIFTINERSKTKTMIEVYYDHIGGYYCDYEEYDKYEAMYTMEYTLELLQKYEPQINPQSFKLYKRSNTIKTILNG
jgi:hypothetical protein